MKRIAMTVLTVLATTLTAIAASAADEGSIARGGKLFENWPLESTGRPQTRPNPTFKTSQVRVAPADTWRCVTCHGWDYKGVGGYPSIKKRMGTDPAAVVAWLQKPPHYFEDLLTKDDFTDLANFVTQGQVDMSQLIDAANQIKTPGPQYTKLFATICANCHGMDGGMKREIQPLGETAKQAPAKILHVILNGHAGGDMPAFRAFDHSLATGMLAYIRTLPGVNMAASVANGGRLYDDWQSVTGRKQALPQPSYPATGFYANAPSVNWRCAECHGWDYKGNQGQYATGNHATGIKGIRAMAGADPEQIMNILRNKTHYFGNVLKYRDLQDVANFVAYGQVDMDTSIDPKTGFSLGDVKHGAVYYGTMCVTCHGKEGKFVAKRFLGRSALKEPWQAMHTMLNGHPDDPMPALREIDNKIIADILAYVQNLPEKR